MKTNNRRLVRKIKSFYRRPYKQFMFHFQGRNSIDARNMNQEELDFCRLWYRDIGFWKNGNFIGNPYNQKIGFWKNGNFIGNPYNQKTAAKLFELWRPQELI